MTAVMRQLKGSEPVERHSKKRSAVKRFLQSVDSDVSGEQKSAISHVQHEHDARIVVGICQTPVVELLAFKAKCFGETLHEYAGLRELLNGPRRPLGNTLRFTRQRRRCQPCIVDFHIHDLADKLMIKRETRTEDSDPTVAGSQPGKRLDDMDATPLCQSIELAEGGKCAADAALKTLLIPPATTDARKDLGRVRPWTVQNQLLHMQ